MFFHAKIGILGKDLYVIHTLFILYFDGNRPLFGEKIYFIWKFSSGNTDQSNIWSGLIQYSSEYPTSLQILYLKEKYTQFNLTGKMKDYMKMHQ